MVADVCTPILVLSPVTLRQPWLEEIRKNYMKEPPSDNK